MAARHCCRCENAEEVAAEEEAEKARIAGEEEAEKARVADPIIEPDDPIIEPVIVQTFVADTELEFTKAPGEKRKHRDGLASHGGVLLDYMDTYMGPHPALRRRQEKLTYIPKGSLYEKRSGDGFRMLWEISPTLLLLEELSKAAFLALTAGDSSPPLLWLENSREFTLAQYSSSSEQNIAPTVVPIENAVTAASSRSVTETRLRPPGRNVVDLMDETAEYYPRDDSQIAIELSIYDKLSVLWETRTRSVNPPVLLNHSGKDFLYDSFYYCDIQTEHGSKQAASRIELIDVNETLILHQYEAKGAIVYKEGRHFPAPRVRIYKYILYNIYLRDLNVCDHNT